MSSIATIHLKANIKNSQLLANMTEIRWTKNYRTIKAKLIKIKTKSDWKVHWSWKYFKFFRENKTA